MLDAITILELDTATFEAAGRLDPPALRPLDALHVASAVTLGDDLESLVTYDHRLASVAQLNGVQTSAPA